MAKTIDDMRCAHERINGAMTYIGKDGKCYIRKGTVPKSPDFYEFIEFELPKVEWATTTMTFDARKASAVHANGSVVCALDLEWESK